jgi:hypothetical protein
MKGLLSKKASKAPYHIGTSKNLAGNRRTDARVIQILKTGSIRLINSIRKAKPTISGPILRSIAQFYSILLILLTLVVAGLDTVSLFRLLSLKTIYRNTDKI